ncbi:hypothetical protein OsI_22535 [Oryza sativa Indica Group]|uniref:Uncharacterized protein n=1 Tax=Oryza sativa subsp. indica TaxID=39946 RepID=B8B0L4_ORYSI|nr:hypothetical protein OsI_22535 [Oryza sativa Indica Group]
MTTVGTIALATASAPAASPSGLIRRSRFDRVDFVAALGLAHAFLTTNLRSGGCLRCHWACGIGFGGELHGQSWLQLAALRATDPPVAAAMKPPTGGRSGGAHQCALEECEHGLQLLQLGLQGLGRGAALTAERHYGPAELLQLRGYCRGVGALALRLSMPLLTMPFLGIMALLLSFTMSIIGVAVTVLALGIAVVIAPHVTVATGGATTASGAVVAVVAPETVGARCTLCGRPRDADIMTAFLFTAFLGGMGRPIAMVGDVYIHMPPPLLDLLSGGQQDSGPGAAMTTEVASANSSREKMTTAMARASYSRVA